MKSKRMQGWVFGVYGGEQKYIQGLVGGNLRKEPLGRPRHRWKDNIENVWHGLDSSG